MVEPALAHSDAMYIERLISIYMGQNDSSRSEMNSKSADESKVYTVDDWICGPTKFPRANAVTDSIWREAPGMCMVGIPRYSFIFDLYD